MKISYRVNASITLDQFIELLRASTLGERRPIENRVCMQGMLDHANVIITAWDEVKPEPTLVGIARCITDFHYCCYLSDLAVHQEYQRMGIGVELQRRVQAELQPTCKVILLAAPAAAEYYPHIGYTKHDGCWIARAGDTLG